MLYCLRKIRPSVISESVFTRNLVAAPGIRGLKKCILHVGEIDVLRCSRIRENSGNKSTRVRILTNPATIHSIPMRVYID